MTQRETFLVDVTTRQHSKVHDARISQNSKLADQIPVICATKYHLLGDVTYLLREYLPTPIRDYGNMPKQCKMLTKKCICHSRNSIKYLRWFEAVLQTAPTAGFWKSWQDDKSNNFSPPSAQFVYWIERQRPWSQWGSVHEPLNGDRIPVAPNFRIR